ncbi:MAG: conjugal transfer protein TraH [Candidatus Anaerobiospirillum merdipullorum]|uniref:Conjugal transfer protein TraH n=1 Tax=Candidatus Anaerobiospirillum merdipullorum TaxID=2838450 RepID=A0A9E2NS89_9GAMM|nr:conjugal transfer protein TraH [Candidatus Anaerobiospirillum merdipullorum]
MNLLRYSYNRMSQAVDCVINHTTSVVQYSFERTAKPTAHLAVTVAHKIGRFNTALALTLTFAISGNVMAANFVDEVMDGVLGGMSNVTTPGAYAAASRGVLSGGSIYARAKIFDANIATFVPPSFRAGCGGIDLFGGSFSFINSDQLVQLFRSIAANAVGMLFQMALATVCSICQTLIQKFQDIVQSLNAMLNNSCELATGIVTNPKETLGKFQDGFSKIQNSANDMGDAFESWINSFSGVQTISPVDSSIKNNPDQASDMNMYGNIVWKAINEEGLPGRYLFSGSDIAETLMSITGSIIVQKPVDTNTAPSASGDGSNSMDGASPVQTLQPRLEVKDFLDGSQNNHRLTIYHCSDGTGADQCLTVSDQAFVFDGYKQRLYRSLCGNDLGQPCTGGAIQQLATNNGGTGAALNAEHQQVILSLPRDLGADLVSLAIAGSTPNPNNPSALASNFIQDNIGAIALVSAQYTVDEIFKSVLETLSAQKGSWAQKAITEVTSNRDRVMSQYQTLVSQEGSLDSLKSKVKDQLELYADTPQEFNLLINQKAINTSN